MTTPSSWLVLLAVIVFVAGAALSLTRHTARMRLLGLVATLLVVVVTCWIAWFSGVTPAGA
jgi:hypothetical protein